MPDDPQQHFTDYGFDPQIKYLQVLEEAMMHKRETSRSIDSIHFRLQKPISKDYNINKPNKKKRWWRTALLFFNWRRPRHHQGDGNTADVHQARASISGPVYLTESRSGPASPYRRRTTASRPTSGPLSGTLTPQAKGDLDIPYLSLRELTMEQQQLQRMSTSAMPIYLVT